MFDIVRIYRVLTCLAEEKDHFLLCQDAYPTLISIQEQLNNIPAEIARLESIEPRDPNVRYLKAISEDELSLAPILAALVKSASDFYLPAPIDNPDDKAEKWQLFQKEPERLDEFGKKIMAFQSLLGLHAKNKIFRAASRLLDGYREAFSASKPDGTAATRLSAAVEGNFTTAGFLSRRQWDLFEPLAYIAMQRPFTHLDVVAPELMNLLGFSEARLLALPYHEIVTSRNADVDDISKPQLVTYTRADKGQCIMHWDSKRDGEYTLVSRGRDVTDVILKARKEAEKRFEAYHRRWLHSLRNANAGPFLDELLESLQAFKECDPSRYAAKLDELIANVGDAITVAKRQLLEINQSISQSREENFHLRGTMQALLSTIRTRVRSEGKERSSGLPFVDRSVYVNGDKVDVGSMPALPEVRGYELAFTQMVENIVSNAIRYTHPERGVRLKLSLTVKDAFVDVQVDVLDFGSGLPESVQSEIRRHWGADKIQLVEKVTDTPYIGNLRSPLAEDLRCLSRASSTSPDSGMCLSTETGMPHIIALGPKLNATVKTGKNGTRFEFQSRFSIVAPAPAPGPVAGAGGASAPRRQQADSPFTALKILHVDDQRSAKRMMKRFLNNLGVLPGNVQQAASVSEALSQIDGGYHPDVIFTDRNMGAEGGDELVKAIAARPGVNPLMFMVTGDDKETVPDDVRSHLVDVITTPLIIQKVKAALEQVVTKSLASSALPSPLPSVEPPAVPPATISAFRDMNGRHRRASSLVSVSSAESGK